jgi:ornithine cyclodeaminase/alanine dehydrogenase-like protein (mu-crystallin family)/GrpB-like predicted nucleotidyltransferase (UPF0157 family)
LDPPERGIHVGERPLRPLQQAGDPGPLVADGRALGVVLVVGAGLGGLGDGPKLGPKVGDQRLGAGADTFEHGPRVLLAAGHGRRAGRARQGSVVGHQRWLPDPRPAPYGACVITVVEYDPGWPARFEALATQYAEAMAAAGVPVVAIEHVGSTSVPGLAAKPVIDCDIVVAAEHVEAAIAVLAGLGFTPLGDLGIAQRWAFREPEQLAATNTYVIVDGSLSLRNHRALRDRLRADPQLRDEYGRVKKAVGARAHTMEEYGRGKNAIVQRILAAAGLSPGERAAIDGQQVPPRLGLTGSRPASSGSPGRANSAPVRLLTDADIMRHLTASDAVGWMAEAVDAHHRGDLTAPPRVHAELGEGRIVFTAGRLRGTWFGYRSYDTFPGGPGAQIVAIHNEADGAARAVAVGKELGPRRVGAIGGVAAEALAPAGTVTVAVLGAGVQAATQVWGLAAVRTIGELRVCSRDAARRAEFAARMAVHVAGAVRTVPDPRAAVEGADVVIVATSSAVPVLRGSWLAPGSYVTTVGPKQRDRAEFGLDLPSVADLLVADSTAQVDAYDPPHVLVGTPHRDRLVSLGAVRAGDVSLPPAPSIRAFFSVGLAGTEAFLLNRILSVMPVAPGRWERDPRPGRGDPPALREAGPEP